MKEGRKKNDLSCTTKISFKTVYIKRWRMILSRLKRKKKKKRRDEQLPPPLKMARSGQPPLEKETIKNRPSWQDRSNPPKKDQNIYGNFKILCFCFVFSKHLLLDTRI